MLAILEVAIGGPCSATDLADRLYISRGAMTGMVRRLTEQGWIETQPDPLDGRRLAIRATARPRRLLHEWACRFSADITERVGVAQVEQLTSDVTQCATELEQHRAIVQRLGPIEVRQLMHTD